MTDPLLSVTDLSVSYGRVHAVRGISFDVAAGSLVTLVGANGAGKSSVINAIAGVVKPSAGKIVFDGVDVTKSKSHHLVPRGLVQVPEGRQILATMTIAENLQLGARFYGAGASAGIDEMYQRFPVLGERRKLAAGSLSGGEQQMLAIARAMLARPKLILMDEPSMGLAPKIVNEVFGVIDEVLAGGTTVLLVEQNARRALQAASEGHVLQNGEIVRSGASEALLADDDIIQAYLGTGREKE
ncbi:ABC transporter ATP-binding protein [Microbacterium esteraromaticum]|uniref:ABC transporter ATP-binding protein n=1 Tax=Microbacterium esteraromaticum TaxID=57043 RepID=A0A939IUL4_9MICO|nr:ABC transporter ATP-binding protein [Microbacterium esteraromaticum]MBN8205521.1 ABC transporter ATP-binding protein [Microbacterium esteraromaticum]MBN8415675.1 ABC transporter ATP-binding protein [Microbacterium esteraromaticum]MCA1305684.1 ABC transporter ATP-binding protein [Microbacterium esteraromaticum]